MLGLTGSPPDARYSIVLAHGVPRVIFLITSNDSIVEGDKGGILMFLPQGTVHFTAYIYP